MICDMIVFDMNHFHLCSDSLHRLFKEYAHYLLFIVLTNLKIFKRIKMPPLRISHSNNITPHITVQYSHAAYLDASWDTPFTADHSKAWR